MNEPKKRGRPSGLTPRRAAIFINCTAEERALIAEAMEYEYDGAEVPISTWAREVLVQAAEKIIKREKS